MQAVSGSRKDGLFFLMNEVPCVNVVSTGRCFVPAYFQSTSVFSHRSALKQTNKYPHTSFPFVFGTLAQRLHAILPSPGFLVPLFRRGLDPFQLLLT